MSDEVNVFMDPFLNVYTNAGEIAVADRLTESFHKDIVLREQQRNTELFEPVRVIQSKLYKAMERDKPKQANCSTRVILESKLDNAKEKNRQRDGKNNKKEKEDEKVIKHDKPIDESEETDTSDVTILQKEKCIHEQNKQTEAVDLCGVTTGAHTAQKHEKNINTKEQREQNILLQMRNEETLGMCKPKSYMLIELVKEKDPECLKKNILEEQHDARLENVKSSEPNPTEAQQYNDTLKTMEDKENIETDQPNNTEKKYINTKPEEHAYDNVYEDPDLLTNYSSAGYVHKTEQHLREKFKCLDNVTLHIAVTGSTGAGKSSFINAIRGLKYDDKNAAPTGVTETTMLPTMYEHPTMPNVKFWDLPGTGSPKFKAKKYLKDVKLETYDFFIIISSERFKENDIMLAKAIKERKKIFYFLRSKIDNDIAAESQRKDFDEQKLLSLIRQDCQRNLRDLGDPYVFLICSFDLHKYDFQALTDTLANQLLDHKRDALILSLPVYSSKILEEKINTFMKQTRSAAVASGSIAVAPVPGLSIACDAVILLAFFTKCYYAFGLDDDSVEKLSKRVNNPFLKSIRKSPLVVAIGQNKLSSDVLSTLTSKEAGIKFAWSMVPGVGSKKAAEMSYSATLGLLRAGLQELADTARQMLKAAGVADVY